MQNEKEHNEKMHIMRDDLVSRNFKIFLAHSELPALSKILFQFRA